MTACLIAWNENGDIVATLDGLFQGTKAVDLEASGAAGPALRLAVNGRDFGLAFGPAGSGARVVLPPSAWLPPSATASTAPSAWLHPVVGFFRAGASAAIVATSRQPDVGSSAPLAGSAVYQPSELPATATMS